MFFVKIAAIMWVYLPKYPHLGGQPAFAGQLTNSGQPTFAGQSAFRRVLWNTGLLK